MVLTTMVTVAIAGCVVLVLGLAALGMGQPYAVWYPLVLVGGLSAVICGALVTTVKKRYEQLELRRAVAMDL